MNENVTITLKETSIIPVNRRVLCTLLYQGSVFNEDTKLWETAWMTAQDKSGQVKEIPRFIVIKSASDCMLETDGKPYVPQTGDELFAPMSIDVIDFSFPQVKDPISGEILTVLEQMEIGCVARKVFKIEK